MYIGKDPNIEADEIPLTLPESVFSYDVSFYCPVASASPVGFAYAFTRDCYFPKDFRGSIFRVLAPFSNVTTYQIYKNNAVVGTVTLNDSEKLASIATATSITFNVGDIMMVTASTPNGFTSVFFTFKGILI